MSYRTFQGDALKHLSNIDSESFDALITDPPYSTGGQFRSDRAQTTGTKYTTTGTKAKPFTDFPGDNRDGRSFQYWMTLILSECFRTLKPGAPVCLFTDWRQLPTMSDAMQAAGFVWRGVHVWDKKNGRPVPGRFRQSTEFVIWGSKGPLGSGDRGVGYLPGMTSCSVNKGGRFHQTGKPVELMKEVVKICEPGGTVLDPFMGSGSTGVACAELGRGFTGIEYTEHYHGVAVERLEDAFNQGNDNEKTNPDSRSNQNP